MRTLCVCALLAVMAVAIEGCGNVSDVPAGAPPTTASPPPTDTALEPTEAAPPPTSPSPAPTRPSQPANASPPPADGAPPPATVGATPPPATPLPQIRDRFDEVDVALAELVTGNVAFNAPERMRFRESRTIALIASPEMNQETLGAELRERIGGDDPVSVEALQIAPLMEARLEGAPGFDVTPLTASRQPVGRAAPTEWRWNVRAHEAGTHTLHLTIDAILTVDGERFPRSLNVLDRDIEVEITAVQQFGRFVEGNWQWVAGTIVIPLAVWWWTSRSKGRRRRS